MQGYNLVKQEFERVLRGISQLGYGLIFIAHSDKRIEKIDEENSVEKISPQIPKRGLEIVNQMVDIIGFINQEFDENGNDRRVLITRRTPHIVAGSRFKNLPAAIPFGYQNLLDALDRAIEKDRAEGATVVESAGEEEETIIRPFLEIRDEAEQIWKERVKGEPEKTAKLAKLIEEVFGKPIRLGDITEQQSELFDYLVTQMREI